jgi:ATP-dependent Lon protease
MSEADDADDFDLPAVERDDVVTGAAANSADWDERHAGLPRLLRYAMLVSDNFNHIEQRLIAEIDELCPNLPLNKAWASALEMGAGLALAAELDHRAVTDDVPKLRGLADSVRLLCLPAPRGVNDPNLGCCGASPSKPRFEKHRFLKHFCAVATGASSPS